MNYVACWFSGTGNTLHAVEVMEKILKGEGHSLMKVRMTGCPDAPDLSKPDRLIVAFPVYSFAPPALVSAFLRSLPSGNLAGGKTREAAILAVDGGDGRFASEKARSILERKGWRVLGSGRAGYPANWRQMTHVLGIREAAAMTADGDIMARAFIKDILDGKEARYRPLRKNILVDSLLAPLFSLVGRRGLGKLFYADADCNSCGLCARSCPAGTIVMGSGKRSKPYWKMNCQNCNRCVNLCPRKAIVTSLGRMASLALLETALTVAGIAAWGSVGSPLLASTGLPPPARAVLGAIAIAIIAIAAAILAFGPLDRFLLRPLQRIPGIRRFFSWTFNKGWHQYLHPGFKP